MKKGQKIGEKSGKFIKCKICKQSFYIRPSRIGKRFTCSKKCMYQWKMKNLGVNKKCINCKKQFHIGKCRQEQKFCCSKCHFEYKKIHKNLHPNYRGGKYTKCKLCGNSFWIIPYYQRQHKKYCSLSCYMKDPKSPNRQFGKNNPMANSKNREKVRNGIIKHIENTIYDGKRFVPLIGKNETFILDLIEQQENIKIERQYKIGGYFVDGYCKELNIVFEVDEIYHKKQKEKDKTREDYIKEKLNCKFIRIKDY